MRLFKRFKRWRERHRQLKTIVAANRKAEGVRLPPANMQIERRCGVIDYENLHKALDFMRIWIADNAHLGESAISREFEKAEGLRRLAAIEDAIVAALRGNAEHCEEIVQCRACRYFPICSFTENYADPEIFYTWGEKKEDE